jgi:Tfp pilus assembly protein PilF
VALAEQEEWEEAIASFRKAIEVNPEYRVSRLNLAFALAELGRDAEATEELKAVLAHEPDNQPAIAKLEELQAPRREKVRAQGETRA